MLLSFFNQRTENSETKCISWSLMVSTYVFLITRNIFLSELARFCNHRRRVRWGLSHGLRKTRPAQHAAATNQNQSFQENGRHRRVIPLLMLINASGRPHYTTTPGDHYRQFYFESLDCHHGNIHQVRTNGNHRASGKSWKINAVPIF